MDKRDEYIQWIKHGLAANSYLSQAELGRRLGLDRSLIARILNGKRKLRLEEIQIIAAYIGTPAPHDIGVLPVPTSVMAQSGLPLVGRIERHVWTDQIQLQPPHSIVYGIMDQRYPAREQQLHDVNSPCTPSPAEKIPKGTRINTLPWANYRSKPILGDLVVVERMQSTLCNWILAVAVADENGTVYLAPATDGATQEEVGHPIRLVIGIYTARS